MTYKHVVLLSESEEEMLQKLIIQKGYRQQEIFRYRLREIFRKEFPVYGNSKKKPWYSEYSPSEYCEKIGGTVEGKFCVVNRGGEMKKIPLARVKIVN